MISIERRAVTLSPAEERALRQHLLENAPGFADALQEGAATALVTQPFFRRHRIIEVEATGAFPVRSMFLALTAGGEPRILTGSLVTLNRLVGEDPPPRIDAGGTARIYANVCDEWTRDSEHGELVIDSLDELPVFDTLEPAERALVEDLHVRLGDVVAPIDVQPGDAGWEVTKWLVASRALIHRRLRVAPTGHLLREDTVCERGLPVAMGLVWGFVDGRLVPVG